MSVSLGNLLLCMCEELARARYTLRQVLEVSGFYLYTVCIYIVSSHVITDFVEENWPFAYF